MGTAPLCGDPQYNKAKKFRFEVALVYFYFYGAWAPPRFAGIPNITKQKNSGLK
jgi:hypothetical protein